MDIRFEELPARPIVGVRAHVTIADIGATIGRLLPVVMAAAGDAVAGPPLALWHAWEGDGGDMELAVPVRGSVEGTEQVKPSTLPACRAAVYDHVGPYEGLAQAWDEMKAWLAAHGHGEGDPSWEEYHSDCAVTPPEKLLTRIVWPLARA